MGACVATLDGRLIHSARNRTCDDSGPVGEVWGSQLSAREAARHQPLREGPSGCDRRFATLISRIGPAVSGSGEYERWLRDAGEGWTIDLGRELRLNGTLPRQTGLDVGPAFCELWPCLSAPPTGGGPPPG